MNRTMHNWKAIVGAALLGLALTSPVTAQTSSSSGTGGYGSSGTMERGQSGASGSAGTGTYMGGTGDTTTTGNPCAGLTGTDRENCMRDARNWHQGGSRDAVNPSTTTPVTPGMSARCTQMKGAEREACERAYRQNIQ